MGKRIGMLFLSLFFVPTIGSTLSDQELADFSTYLEEVIKCKKVPGGVVSIMERGRTVFTKSFGYYDVEKTKKITNDTKFCLGSLTKAFTGAVIAKLLSQQISFTWDTPIAQILGPSFRLENDLLTSNVNLRDLLSHKVGVPSNFVPLLVGFPENTSRQQFIEMLAYQKPSEPLRTKFLYSNYMYTLAGYVAEKISGKSWETLVREILFEPLGMNASGFVNEEKNFSQFSPAFVYIDGKQDKIDQNLLYTVAPGGPAGAIYSTVADMAKWMNFQLSNGSELIPETHFSELHTEQMIIPPKTNLYKPDYPISDVEKAYCLGWVSSVYRGYRKVWHSGGIAGYVSMLWLFPDLESGVFVALTGAKDNRHAHPVAAIVNQAADLLIGDTPWLNQSTACSFPAPWKDVTPVPRGTTKEPYPALYWNISVSSDVYAGLYGHLAFGNMTVTTDDDGILLHYGRYGKMRLLPIDRKIFSGYFLDNLSYMTNSDGNTKPFVIEFKFSGNNSIESLEFPVDFSTLLKTSFKRINKTRRVHYRNISNSITSTRQTKDFGTVLSMATVWYLYH